MCGIIGQLKQREKVELGLFNEMRETLFHRGPDDKGTRLLDDETVALGHRRLTIIDLTEAGRQPMCNEDKTVWLTFNGEIYNYQRLKDQLKSHHTFQSTTDSEVLIHGYEEWGMEDLLKKIKGMFAFAIWDNNKKKLFAARDRFGIKPFNYYHDGNQFIFASEIKGIIKDPSVKKELDNNSLADFFIYSYVPHPQSIWKNIKKLLPAHYLVYDKNDHSISVEKYWNLETAYKKIDDECAINKTNDLLKKAVKEHMVSDVPVGLFLSGGYDSSTLLMHMTGQEKKVSSFSLGFEDSEHSEHNQATTVAQTFGANHHQEMLSPNIDNLGTMQTLAAYYDEPYAISSMIPYYYVSKLASKSNKVALAGDGGDEAFAGYRWHYDFHKRYNHPSLKRRLKFLLMGKHDSILDFYYRKMTGAKHEINREPVLNKELMRTINERGLWYYNQFYDKQLDPVKRVQQLDVHTFMLESCLLRADMSSMANSLEVRVPFLDHEIFEFTFGLDTAVYFKPDKKKHLLYENLKQKIDQDILNMPKRGFGFQHLYTLINDDRFYEMIEYGELVKSGIIKENIDLRNTNYRIKFHLLALELWFQNHYKVVR